MSSEIALRVTNVRKVYPIYSGPWARVADALGFGSRKRRREFVALSDISFEVEKGEFFGIIGQNGSGKSTLLQLVAGILTPDGGEVSVNGRVAALLELGAGFNPEFTGRENAVLNAELCGLSRSAIKEVFPQIEDFADIGDFIDRPVKTYSSGMFVRLAFAVQACLDPEILIIDEALAVGDVFFRLKCYRRLDELRKKGCTVILVTHSTEDVLHYCDRALLLDHGNAVFCGAPDEAVSRYYALNDAAVGVGGAVLDADERDLTGFADAEGREALVDWPLPSAFIEAAGLSQVGDDRVTCVRFAVCDELGGRRQLFRQGQTMVVYAEYRVDHEIGVPCAGVVIRTEKGVIVHGRNTAQSDRAAPARVPVGSVIRSRFAVSLDVGPGEYVCNVGLASWPNSLYSTQDGQTMAEIEQSSARHCVLPDAFAFTVIPREGRGFITQPFYGLADLQSICAVTVDQPFAVSDSAVA